MSYVCPELAEIDQKGKREDMIDDESGGIYAGVSLTQKGVVGLFMP